VGVGVGGCGEFFLFFIFLTQMNDNSLQSKEYKAPQPSTAWRGASKTDHKGTDTETGPDDKKKVTKGGGCHQQRQEQHPPRGN
jgi:hypothetical protein